MIPAPLPQNELLRLEALERYQVLDTDFEEAYDDLVQLASQICGTPVALITLLDDKRQWFKAAKGVGDIRETSRDLAFCSHAILDTELMEVPDSSLDPRFADNPLATGAPYVRFYAGVPLITRDGYALGTLCAIDHRPRTLTDEQKISLRRLARQVIQLLELRLANQRLVGLNEFKRRYFSLLAHDLKSPFNGLMNLTQVLQESWQEYTSVQLTDLLGSLHNNASSIYRLVNNLLSWSISEREDFEYNPQTLDLGPVIQQVREELRTLLVGKELTVSLEGLGSLMVQGDPHMVHSVLLNLVANAIKFSPRGGTLVFRLSGEGSEGLWEVEDQGQGMSAEQIEGLLRGPGLTTRPGTQGESGTGLGLLMSREFLDTMGGRLLVRSVPGQGAVVGISLPLAFGTKL